MSTVLRVTKQTIDQSEKKFWEDYGVILHQLSPTPLSAITAMRIAKAVDKHDIAVVEVYRQEDAIAAISARTICDNKNVKIVYSATPNSQRPRNLHAEVTKKVEGWIFASQRLSDLFAEQLNNRKVIRPTHYAAANVEAPKFEGPITLAWIGEIKNTERLKAILEKVDNLDTNIILRISGAGKARDVMPAVRFARALRNKYRVVWVGEEYNKDSEIAGCHAAVQSDNDLTLIETEILQSGRAVISPEEIADFVAAPHAIAPDADLRPEHYAVALRTYYSDL